MNHTTFRKIAKVFRCTLTFISPSLNARVLQLVKTGRPLSMKNPVTLSEKLVTLKIKNYNHNPLVKQCADKYCVRSYVENHGWGGLLNEVIATYENVDDIEWGKLPEQFVIKWNFGVGFNIICASKTELNIEETKSKLKMWKNKQRETYLSHAELQYKNVRPIILVEKYLKPSNGELPPDYKVYCFNGKPIAILYISDRNKKTHQGGFFDLKWNYLGLPVNENRINNYCEFNTMPEKPKSLDIMIEASKDLSQDFPFVRCDFYDIDGKAVFGEMTFTPAGGHDVSQIRINDKDMAEYLIV